jgi:1,4-dihydroxy-2-naphthoate octaprenyltransferase
MHIGKIKKSEKYEDFDPELKKVALTTFALSILFWLFLCVIPDF